MVKKITKNVEKGTLNHHYHTAKQSKLQDFISKKIEKN